MTYGIQFYNENGKLIFTENPVMYAIKYPSLGTSGTVSKATLLSEAISASSVGIPGIWGIRANSSGASVYFNLNDNTYYASDHATGGKLDLILMQTSTNLPAPTSGYGMYIKHTSTSDTLFYSDSLYPTEGFIGVVEYGLTSTTYTDSIINARSELKRYILLPSLSVAVYNRTLSGDTNVRMVTFTDNGSTFTLGLEQIAIAAGGSYNYTTTRPVFINIVQV
ncbi:MAG: hypothetical protein NTV98_06060 [Candidatus Roizmanbacteria bacterium]|nr:hypothetical protein [Candidatus Roizmanbacteria bacterium]